jgi:hypothetical protein
LGHAVVKFSRTCGEGTVEDLNAALQCMHNTRAGSSGVQPKCGNDKMIHRSIPRGCCDTLLGARLRSREALPRTCREGAVEDADAALQRPIDDAAHHSGGCPEQQQ